jgi:DinB family protein
MTTVADGSYRSRLLGLLGERNPIESLEASAKRVEEIARRLGEPGLARSYAPGKWTGKQILAHLADAEMAIGFRTRQTLAEDNHAIQGFDEGAWARRYDDVDVAAALGSFLAVRRWNLALLRRLGPEDLRREAVHPERGPETLGTIVKLLAGHDLNHLGQLEKL